MHKRATTTSFSMVITMSILPKMIEDDHVAGKPVWIELNGVIDGDRDFAVRHVARIAVLIDDQYSGMFGILLMQRGEIVAVECQDGSPFTFAVLENGSVVDAGTKHLDGCENVMAGAAQHVDERPRSEAFVNEETQRRVQRAAVPRRLPMREVPRCEPRSRAPRQQPRVAIRMPLQRPLRPLHWHSSAQRAVRP